MNRQRWSAINNGTEELTQSEINSGWHFCYEFDGLLVGPEQSELKHCRCLPKEHPVYQTVPNDDIHSMDGV